jgi:uncharacterized protein (DUF488 family)
MAICHATVTGAGVGRSWFGQRTHGYGDWVGRAIATIGVYGFDISSFLATLREANVGLVLDVRQRRGVRGREYAWANSLRLQSALGHAGIAYAHHKELAPTTELRHLQYREDALQGVGKRSRVTLAGTYRSRYEREILDEVDFDPIMESLPAEQVSALLCVERDPEACHRSLIAARLREAYKVSVVHLRP